jgi:hypothetical protein
VHGVRGSVFFKHFGTNTYLRNAFTLSLLFLLRLRQMFPSFSGRASVLCSQLWKRQWLFAEGAKKYKTITSVIRLRLLKSEK